MGRVPLLDNADAWTRLPDTDSDKTGQLPSWARALAGALPRTTAATLEADYVQRARSPLDPVLRAQVRWVAARSNHSAFGEAQALADMRRAGVDEAEVTTLRTDWRSFSESRRIALAFARKLTLEAHRVTDDEVATLRQHHGNANTVAIVQCLAYANFQDRLVLSLGCPIEEGGLPPVPVRFRKPYQGGTAAPPRVPVDSSLVPAPIDRITDSEWHSFDFDSLRAAQEAQKERVPRIPVPSPEELSRILPPNAPARFLKIIWSRVCFGYQPELAFAWTNCLRTFEEEAKQDRVFEELLFWVVTRSLQCFY